MHNNSVPSCWSCGEALTEGVAAQIFCGKCSIIQPALKDGNLFELFGIEQHFDVESADLEKRYLKKKYLPIRFAPSKSSKNMSQMAMFGAIQSARLLSFSLYMHIYICI